MEKIEAIADEIKKIHAKERVSKVYLLQERGLTQEQIADILEINIDEVKKILKEE